MDTSERIWDKRPQSYICLASPLFTLNSSQRRERERACTMASGGQVKTDKLISAPGKRQQSATCSKPPAGKVSLVAALASDLCDQLTGSSFGLDGWLAGEYCARLPHSNRLISAIGQARRWQSRCKFASCIVLPPTFGQRRFRWPLFVYCWRVY